MTSNPPGDSRDGAGPRNAFVDTQAPATRAGLIVPDVRGRSTGHSVNARQSEFEGLARAIRLDIVFSEILRIREVRPATFIGGGQVEAIARRVKEEDIDL